MTAENTTVMERFLNGYEDFIHSFPFVFVAMTASGRVLLDALTPWPLLVQAAVLTPVALFIAWLVDSGWKRATAEGSSDSGERNSDG